GHSVVIAGNGRLALEAFDKESFDLVLMDLQMPEMGGLQTTALIREREKGTQTRIPIVAMTAHALSADREECSRAGMDDYVTTPLAPQVLFEEIENADWPRLSQQTELGSLSVTERSLPPASSELGLSLAPEPQPTCQVDRTAILARVEGDAALLKEVIDLFLEDAPMLQAQIRESITGNDAAALERSAHALKGGLGNFGAARACQLAFELEAMGRQRDLARAAALFDQLQRELTFLLPEIQTLIRTKAA